MLAWLALTFIICGLGYAIGMRSYLAWRSTGDLGWRFDAGPAWSAAWWAAVLFLVAGAFLVAAPLGVLFGVPELLWPVPAWARACGLAVAAAGLLLLAAGQLGMGSSWRIGVDHTEVTWLITDGLFALSRNPIYTGMIVFVFGIALSVPGPPSVAAVILMLGAVQLQVRQVEEPYLIAIHGDAYRAYASRTGRFLPHIGRLSTHRATPKHVHRPGHVR